MEEARKNDEVISIASSQVLRWIDEINGVVDGDSSARDIKRQIRQIKKEPPSLQNRRLIRSLYDDLDNLQHKPDYMCLIIDKTKDYRRACQGFSINGIKYKRLLGTTGGIKNSTIVFVSENVADELKRRIDNGRNMEKKFTPAKLEAYKSLTCSASVPVSNPKGLLVVQDLETTFTTDVINLSNTGGGEPEMSDVVNQEITINAADGCGMMLPSIAERWGRELCLDYVPSGVNTRFSFEKGMLLTFDFIEFAESVAGTYIVKDAWGNDVDVRDVEIVMTTSMVKLWDSFDSCEDYLTKSYSNGYTFGVTKTAPEFLENKRSLNYQFIQSYYLDDNDIDELIAPTMNEIKDIIHGDWRRAMLYLRGENMTESSAKKLTNDYAQALMIDKRIFHDPYVKSSIQKVIKNRINKAKVGVIDVHGNYSIASGDLYALCQHIFGMEVTGLLKSGEIYNEYWNNNSSGKLVCFRAPMTCHNNIRSVTVSDSDEARHWFRYIHSCTIFNAWDSAMAALNGMDFDGDIVMLTDNNVLVRKHRPLPALMCAQGAAAKIIPSEEDMIQSNIDSFGNDIGQTTNWITSMFEVQSHFDEDSEQFRTLDYRIRCGQQAQQDCIDRAKGIVCKPMAKNWHDRHAVNKMEDEDERDYYRMIVADKKPYFMRYIYPALMKEYRKFIKDTNRNALREFREDVGELMSKDVSDLTDRQRDFLRYYKIKMPVGVGDCVMNRICRRFEDEFDLMQLDINDELFDYEIMKDNSVEYSRRQFDAVKKLYDEYNKKMSALTVLGKNEKMDEFEFNSYFDIIDEEFSRECHDICSSDSVLCNILLDICYRKSCTKRFAWKMCGETIIHNLLRNNNNTVNYCEMCEDGDIIYSGNRFALKSVVVEV